MNITGKVRVFRDDKMCFPRYSIGVSKKNQDGTYTNGYFEAKFRKGIELANGTDIEIKDGFLTLRTYEKDGRTRKVYFIMVMDYTTLESKSEPHRGTSDTQVTGFEAIPDDYCPF